MLLVLIFFLPASVHRSDVFSKFRLSIWIVWRVEEDEEPRPGGEATREKHSQPSA